jgi:hypothetical protein
MQEGGWSREVTIRELPVSKSIAGVDMRLTAGGIRELHWHTAGEWAIMLYGNARIRHPEDQEEFGAVGLEALNGVRDAGGETPTSNSWKCSRATSTRTSPYPNG